MKHQNLLANFAKYLVLSAAMLGFLFPFALVIMNAFKSNAEIIDSPLALPSAFSLTNFGIAMKAMNYFECFINSLGITIISLVIIMLFSAMAAHFFVRNDTKASKFWFFLMVASMIIPFQSIMIPLVSVYGQQLGWIQANPRLTLIVMYIGFGTPLAVFIYHGFIKSVPKELEEAASIDGCNPWQIFFRIVMPILVPTSVTLGILNVLWIWNDFLLPVLILQNAGPKNLTLPIAIQMFKGTYTSDYEKFLPAFIMVILPILVVYLLAQKFIIQGVTQGAIK